MDAELKQLYDQDQMLRSACKTIGHWERINLNALSASDAQRKLRVEAIIAERGLHDASDFKHAGMVLQHGTNASDFLRAYEYFSRSMELDPSDGQVRSLVACSWDRYLWNSGEPANNAATGRPQEYGTQFRREGDFYTREPFDRTARSDQDRANLGIKSLRELDAELAAMNVSVHRSA